MADVKLNFVHVCDKAFLSQDGKLNLIGIFNKINANNFPAIHSELFVIVSIKNGQGLYDGRIAIEAPSEGIIADAKGQINIGVEGGTGNIITNFRNIVFPSAGKYKIKVFIKDELLEEDYLFLTKE